MKPILIAVIIGKAEDDIKGFRVLDKDSGKTIDVTYDNMLKTLMNPSSEVEGIGINMDGAGELKGTNGAFSRYSKLNKNGALVGNSHIVILEKKRDKKFKVADYTGKTLEASEEDIVKVGERVGIANGKIVEKDGTRFISSINGEYYQADVINSYENIINNATVSSNASKADLSKLPTVAQAKKESNGNVTSGNVDRFEYYKNEVYSEIGTRRIIRNLNCPREFITAVDEKTGLTVEDKMIKASTILRNISPIYFSVYSTLNIMPIVDFAELQTMACSAKCIYYNPEFVLKLPLGELVFTLMHESMHYIMGHTTTRAKKENPKLWNIATDLYINKFIQDEYIEPLNKGQKTIAGKKGDQIRGLLDKPGFVLYNNKVDIKVDTPEGIYDELLKNKVEEEETYVYKNVPQDSQNGAGDGQEGQEGQGNEQDGQNGQNGQGNQNGQEGQGSQNGRGAGQDGNASSGNEQGSNGSQSSSNGESSDSGQSGNGTSAGGQGSQSGCAGSGSSGTGSDGEGTQGVPRKQVKITVSHVKTSFRGQEVNFDSLQHADIDKVSEEESKMSDQDKKVAHSSNMARADAIRKKNLGYTLGGEGLLDNVVLQATKVKVKWSTLLKGKLTKLSQKYNTYAAPDRRFIHDNKILPGPKEGLPGALDNIRVCVDTSGSMTEEELSRVLGAMEALFKKYKADGELILWHTHPYASGPMKYYREALKIMNKNRQSGGTNATSVFEFLSSKEYRKKHSQKPSLVIMITDGYFEEVPRKFSAFDTVWLLTVDNSSFKAPFGKVGYINDYDS